MTAAPSTARMLRFELSSPRATVRMPRDTAIRHVDYQAFHGRISLWGEGDPLLLLETRPLGSTGAFEGADVEERTFQTIGTGEPVPDGSYIGTVLVDGGALVWHVYEVAS